MTPEEVVHHIQNIIEKHKGNQFNEWKLLSELVYLSREWEERIDQLENYLELF